MGDDPILHPPLSILPFDLTHTDDLVAMWRESFEAAVGITDPHPCEAQRDYFLSEVLPKYEVRLAFLGDTLVGFIAATRDEVAQLYVRVGFQRRGIGVAFLDWAKAQSDGSLWLYTFAQNAGARRFYESQGFRAVEFGYEPGWGLEDVRYEWRMDALRRE